MAKLSLRLAFIFLLFAVVSRAQDNAVAGDSDQKSISDTIFPVDQPGSAETRPYEVTVDSPSVELPPLTLITFRHVHRRFPRGPLPLTFRRGRPCRGFNRHRDIPYGNDMILSGDRQIPQRWTEFHGVEPGFEGPRHHPHHHHHHHHDHDEDEFDHHHHHHHDEFDHHHHEHEHEHENRFLKGIRKFLGHF